jgi:hypothetical protein
MVHTALYYFKNCDDMVSNLKTEFPDYTIKQIKSELSNRWKKMTTIDKAPYQRKVNEQSEDDLVCDDVPNSVNIDELEEDQLDTIIKIEKIEKIENNF